MDPLQRQALLQPSQQLGHANRLDQEVLRPDAKLVFHGLVKGIGRDDGRRQRAQALLAQPTQRGPAVDAWHRQVQEDRIDTLMRQQRQCGLARLGLQQLETQRRQALDQQPAVVLLVVDHQQALAWAEVAGAAQQLGPRALAGAGAQFGQVELDRKTAARAGLAAHRELAAHQTGEHARDRQPQAGATAGIATGRRAADEGFEHLGQLGLGQPRAGVLDLETSHLARVIDPKTHLTFAGELHRVAQQVDQDLTQPLLVGPHQFGQVAGSAVHKAQATRCSLLFEQAGELAHRVGKVHRCGLERKPAALDAGDVHRAFDQAEQMVAAAPDHLHRSAPMLGNRRVVLQQLGITQDAVERRSQLVADRGDVAALGLVGGVSAGHGLLELDVGALVRCDLAPQRLGLLVQRLGLATRLLLRELAAALGQHGPPGHHASDQQQHRESLTEACAQQRRHRRGADRVQAGQRAQAHRVERSEQQRQPRHHRDHQQQVSAQPSLEVRCHAPRQQALQQPKPLRRKPGLGFAQIVAACVQRAAQRADQPAVSRAGRHVLRLVAVLADHATAQAAKVAASRLAVAIAAQRGGLDLARSSGAPSQVIAPASGPGDQRRDRQRGDQRDHRRPGLGHRTECAQVRRDAEHRGHAHRADTHRVDVVQVGAAELDALGAQSQRLVDHQIGHHRHDPSDRDVAVQTQHMRQRLEHVELHQHQCNRGVEHHPDHPTRVVVGQARKEIAPRQRPGIGVGDVDLELGDEDKQRGRGHCPAVLPKHVLPSHQVHLVGVDRALRRYAVGQGQVGQQHAGQHLGDTHDHPARPAHQHGKPPAQALARLFLGHETQVIGLLADLGDQRDANGQRSAKAHPAEATGLARNTAVSSEVDQFVGALDQHIGQRQHQQRQPQRLGPDLQTADRRHTVADQRNHQQRAQPITPGRRDVEGQFQRVGHHSGL